MRDEFERWCEERFRVGSSQLCMLEGRELREAWTAAESRGIVKGRIDALREAAGIARSEVWKQKALDIIRQGGIPCVYDLVADAILLAIDQPQEDVCECNADPSHRIGFKFCPYCGKPIKVTHGDKA